MRLQLKILFEIKALPIPEKKNWKNLLRGGGVVKDKENLLAIRGLKTSKKMDLMDQNKLCSA